MENKGVMLQTNLGLEDPIMISPTITHCYDGLLGRPSYLSNVTPLTADGLTTDFIGAGTTIITNNISNSYLGFTSQNIDPGLSLLANNKSINSTYFNYFQTDHPASLASGLNFDRIGTLSSLSSTVEVTDLISGPLYEQPQFIRGLYVTDDLNTSRCFLPTTMANATNIIGRIMETNQGESMSWKLVLYIVEDLKVEIPDKYYHPIDVLRIKREDIPDMIKNLWGDCVGRLLPSTTLLLF